MTKKTKAPVREVSKAKPVREGLAFLIEDALERSEVVIAAEAIVDKLQGMAEDLSTVEAKEIMPLLDSLSNAFGPQVAQKFNAVATEQVRQLISAVQSAKTALDGEIARLKQGVDGGDTSDMGLDASTPMMPGGPPEEPGMAPQMGPGGDVPPPEGGLDMPPDEGLGGGNFAGREKKEGALESRKAPKVRRRVEEDMTPRVPVPHSHESTYFNDNLSNLSVFHGGAGRLAQSIANMIRTEELSLDQRKGLASVLSHLAAFAAEPAHWSGVDADKKLEMSLQSANIWKTDSPALQKIVGQLKRLTHLLSLHHDRMLESNISLLRKATDPDAIILQMFRTKLRENKDGQMAAIRTARAFAIDIEDVVAVVREAAARRPFPAKLTEKPKFGGKQAKPFTKKGVKEDAPPWETDEAETEDTSKDDKSEKKSDQPFGGKQAKPFGKKGVEEDAPPLMQGVPMFPIDQSGAANAQSGVTTTPNATDVQPQQMVPSNQSGSTNQPLSPADMRARQTAQQNAQQQQTAINQVVQANNAPEDANKPAKPTGMGQPANGQPPSRPTGMGQPKANNQAYQPPGKAMDASALKRASR